MGGQGPGDGLLQPQGRVTVRWRLLRMCVANLHGEREICSMRWTCVVGGQVTPLPPSLLPLPLPAPPGLSPPRAGPRAAGGALRRQGGRQLSPAGSSWTQLWSGP